MTDDHSARYGVYELCVYGGYCNKCSCNLIAQVEQAAQPFASEQEQRPPRHGV